MHQNCSPIAIYPRFPINADVKRSLIISVTVELFVCLGCKTHYCSSAELLITVKEEDTNRIS